MRIPFDITKRPQIESGEYKVETGTGKKVRIICWDKKSDMNKKKIVALLDDGNSEHTEYYTEKGTVYDKTPAGGDLFIITPEPELSEFEKGCIRLYQDGRDDGFAGDNLSNENLKECSAKLLALAREQFIKDGYVIEKKAFHDAVEKVAPEVMKEVSDKVDMEEAIRLGYEKGKAEALKDLPRWRTIEETTTKRTDENDCVTTETMLVKGCMNRNDYRIIWPECMVNRKMLCIPVVELSKLPGFKED